MSEEIQRLLTSFAPSLSQKKEEAVETLIPALPIQRVHLARSDPHPHMFVMYSLVDLEQPTHSANLESATKAVINHHNALRLRFVHTVSGWQTYLSTALEPTPFLHIDLSSLEDSQQQRQLEMVVAALKQSLDFTVGPVLRIAYFDLGRNKTGRLFLVIHHFLCDAYSWSILLEDFFTAYTQLNQGQPVHLPSQTTSIVEYAKRLATYAQSETLLHEINYWESALQTHVVPVPLDYPDGVALPRVSDRTLIDFNERQTRTLLALAKYRITIRDILLAAFLQVYQQWTDEESLLVDVLNHGRTTTFGEVDEDFDLLRTFGWLTTHVPLLLKADRQINIRECIFSVREQLLRIPNGGIGYGVLRHLSTPDIQDRFACYPEPQITFNYLGRFSKQDTEGVKAQAHQAHSPEFIDPKRFRLVASVVGHCLHIRWGYQKNLHKGETIEALALSLKKKILDIEQVFQK